MQKLLRFTFCFYGRMWVTCPEVATLSLLQFSDRRVSRGGRKLRSWRWVAYRGGWSREPPALRHGPLDNHTERMVHHWDSTGYLTGQTGAQHRCERRWVWEFGIKCSDTFFRCLTFCYYERVMWQSVWGCIISQHYLSLKLWLLWSGLRHGLMMPKLHKMYFFSPVHFSWYITCAKTKFESHSVYCQLMIYIL